MLRHTGNKRSFRHDLRLAILLCLNAGFINAAGFIAFAVLTTNVTGHAALIAVNVASGQWRAAQFVAVWLLLFLAGAFLSSWYIGKVGREKSFAYTLPLVIIFLIIVFVAVTGHNYHHTMLETEYFAGSLLFAMGMQNAVVSIVSGSVVRTTHLTGMVTDLGIDLAAVISNPKKKNEALKRRIFLRLTIIFSFLSGGIVGGIAFLRYGYAAFFGPAFLIVVALFYDYFRIMTARWLQQFLHSFQ